MSRCIGATFVGLLVPVLAACGGGSPTTVPDPASADAGSGACSATEGPGTVEVAIDGRAFVPGRVTAAVGDVIAFRNDDPVGHTATLDDGSCTTETLGSGETGALVFSAPGEYPFHCRIHPDMTGTFVIGG